MGFLSRLFASDPRRDIERAEALLEKGEAARALELARRAEERAQAPDRSHAARLAARARSALVAGALEKAELAESSEYFEDAVEWISAALEHVADEAERQELEERLGTLEAQARAADREDPWEPPPPPEAEPATQLDPDTHYLALVGMLGEDFADLYEDRPAAFRRAYVDLNEGRIEAALETLDLLAEARGEDPVTLFERGRCRLMLGDTEGALADLEAAQETFGDRAVDLTGDLSVPVLWAEAMLVLGRHEPVIERLEALAAPAAGNPAISYRYAQALLAAERFDDARKFLAVAASTYPGNPVFPQQLALVLVRLGEKAAAIDCLEAAIAPSCAGGRCGRPRKHLPSIRALASLYLDEGDSPDRVRELMKLVALELSGQLTSEDHALLARFHEQTGDPEAAALAAAEADRLRSEGAVSEGRGTLPAPLGAQKRAPL
jgi:tetratricopeptide (TPR) repeat protein